MHGGILCGPVVGMWASIAGRIPGQELSSCEPLSLVQKKKKQKKNPCTDTEFHYFYVSAEKVISLILLIWQLHVDFQMLS